MGRSDLPQEMVEDILSRLPAKSLKRFSCVNKSWSTLFQNPCFIAKHQHLSQKNWSIFASGVVCEADKPVLFLHPNLDDDDFDSRGIIMESPFLEEPKKNEEIVGSWVMREYGIKESWTKQYDIRPFSGIPNIAGFEFQILLLGDKILMVEDNGEVVLYNLSAQKIKNLRVRGLSSLFRASQIIVYESSLVSIMG